MELLADREHYLVVTRNAEPALRPPTAGFGLWTVIDVVLAAMGALAPADGSALING